MQAPAKARVFLPASLSFSVPSRRASRKVKRNWASLYKPQGASQLALDYMDAHYPRLYGQKRWPLMRCALLSRPKYGLLANSYLDTLKCHAVMMDVGAEDVLVDARMRLSHFSAEGARRQPRLVPPIASEDSSSRADECDAFQAALETAAAGSPDESLDFFVPSKSLYSPGGFDLHAEADERAEEELRASMRDPHDVVEERVPERRVALKDIPSDLTIGITRKGSVETYPTPFHSLDRLGYYLFDAASLLPVLALDLADGDEVADLCAAPGGKTLAMLFTKRPKSVVAIDKSWSRIQRFKEVMFSYLPKSAIDPKSPDNRVQFFIRDALTWRPDREFDKILVDVPCSNDRLSVNEDENNVFAPGKTVERENLPEYQSLLLHRAYDLCRPGGVIVYSTCTLSPSQNDGVIRRFFEKFPQIHPNQLPPLVVDLNSFVPLFGRHFLFFGGCQYGIQVIPSLNANFGPTYICKLRKPES